MAVAEMKPGNAFVQLAESGVQIEDVGIERQKLPCGYLHHRFVPVVFLRGSRFVSIVHHERPVDDVGLAGVVHSIAWNSTPEGDWEITIDFGSAPVAAFGELLYLLLDSGAESVVLRGPNELGHE